MMARVRYVDFWTKILLFRTTRFEIPQAKCRIEGRHKVIFLLRTGASVRHCFALQAESVVFSIRALLVVSLRERLTNTPAASMA